MRTRAAIIIIVPWAATGGAWLLAHSGASGAQVKAPPTEAEVTRAKQVVADFLRVPVGKLQGGTARILQGGPEDRRQLWFDGWRIPTTDGGAERFRAGVDLDAWYVTFASWPDRDFGPQAPPGAKRAAKGRIRAVATAFAGEHFPRWSSRMRLEAFRRWGGETDPAAYRLLWQEQVGDWYTGSSVTVSVSAWQPPAVQRYSARIAPSHAPEQAKIDRDRAIAIATWIAEHAAKEPVRLLRIEGWLSHSLVPGRGPTWVIRFETKRRLEGLPADRCSIFIDAVTGADVTWALLPEGPPPNWPKPQDMPPELRPTPHQASPPTTEPPQ